MSNDTLPSVYHILKSFDCLEVEIVDENKIFCFTKFQ